MEELSNKAIIVLEILKKLNAIDNEHRTNIYEILDMLEKTDLKEILPDELDYELDNLECEMTQKSVSTTLASLVRKGYVIKTDISSVMVNNVLKNIRSYYLVK